MSRMARVERGRVTRKLGICSIDPPQDKGFCSAATGQSRRCNAQSGQRLGSHPPSTRPTRQENRHTQVCPGPVAAPAYEQRRPGEPPRLQRPATPTVDAFQLHLSPCDCSGTLGGSGLACFPSPSLYLLLRQLYRDSPAPCWPPVYRLLPLRRLYRGAVVGLGRLQMLFGQDSP
jgi:hypothetical protein